MHDSVRTYIEDQVWRHKLAAKSVWEIGSYNVNGSVRDLFTGPYLGIDGQKGPSVDLVAKWPPTRPIAHPKPDVVLCLEMLEHDTDPQLSLDAIVGLGATWVFLTTRSPGFPFHAYPEDNWRFSKKALRVLLAKCEGIDAYRTHVIDDTDRGSPGVFASLIRKG